MLEDRVLTRETMKSSWAGAMGLTQFMPSEYYTVAYDLDGDGRKDIWNSVADALASAANQLRGKGLGDGPSWGYEVRLPPRLDCLGEGPDPCAIAARMGQARRGPHERPRVPGRRPGCAGLHADAAGAYGPAFLALENFMVIKRYNMSDLYAMFVGNLADRIAGGGDFDTPWGDVRQLSRASIEEIQQRLQARGYEIAKIDGKAGMNTRALIGAYQQASRLKVDCWPSEAVLTHLRAVLPLERLKQPPARAPGRRARPSGGLSCQGK